MIILDRLTPVQRKQLDRFLGRKPTTPPVQSAGSTAPQGQKDTTMTTKYTPTPDELAECERRSIDPKRFAEAMDKVKAETSAEDLQYAEARLNTKADRFLREKAMRIARGDTPRWW